ncbi:MAG: carboxypeptidase regulatory-like domain-containing protein [Elusimicrobia bacterium]|nr:carboxypeptidase regulatory-like domain-containing protein [Elusimicrobiota bacterium]
MSKRCPSCRTEVADDARVCPNCPWEFPEEEADNPPPAAVAQSWSPLPLVITGVVAAAIGLGWYFVVKVYHEETTEPTTLPPAAAVPAPPAPAPEPALEPVTTKPAAPVSTKPGKAVAKEEGAEEPVQTVTVVKEAHQPPPKKVKPVKEWKLRGFVYDLVTLQPVPRCKITLSDVDTNANFETATDASGRYRAILPPLPERGYLIEISASGYVKAYLDPGTEGVRNKPAGQRQDLCKELGPAVLQPASLQPHGADPLVTDFFIAPVNCK